MANRTFVRLGALAGASARLALRRRVCVARRATATDSDQRERLVQFRAGARIGSRAVAGGAG